MTTAILGAGIAGLSTACHLQDNKLDFRLFEASNTAGGLLASFKVDDFVFDNAVHLSFASEPEVRAEFDKTDYITHEPESLNWDDGLWIRHPVQNNMFPLPAEERVRLIKGLVDQPSGLASNYKDWLVHQYGDPIAERWPLRYTRKYWRVGAEELGVNWVGQRMRKADLEEVLRGALSRDKQNTYYVKEMRYPKEGGYYSFVKPMVERCAVELDHRATRVSLKARTVSFSNGTSMKFERLVNTIPLPVLVGMIDEAPDNIKNDAKDLCATQIDLISIGFNKPDVSPSLWFYIYDEEIQAARAYSPSWKSPQNAPEGNSSLQFEIYSLPGEDVDRSPQFLIDNTKEALSKMGLAKERDILFAHHKRIQFGNVVFLDGMEEKRDRILTWLEKNDVYSAGRFGCWEYYWSNQAFMSGLKAAKKIVEMVEG